MTYRLRVHAIPLSDDNGGRAATLTATQLSASLAAANVIYRAADIEFVFDAEIDWEPMRDTWLNTMDRGDADWPKRANDVADRYPGKVVMFFRFGNGTSPTGNGFAYPPDIGRPIPPTWQNEAKDVHFVTLPSTRALVDQDPNFFSHEIGHYLGLYHTFPFATDRAILSLADGETLTPAQAEQRLVRYVRANGGTLAALNGDLLGDTAADPGTTFWTMHGHARCGGVNSVRLTGTLDGQPYDLTLNPPRNNIMSYFACAPGALTANQVERIHATLAHPARNHLLPRKDLATKAIGANAAAGSAKRLTVAASADTTNIRAARWDRDEAGQQWQGWFRITDGTARHGAPVTAVARDPDRLDFFVVPGDGRVWTAARDARRASGAYRGWWRIGDLSVPASAQVGAVARRSDKLDVVAAAADGRVWTAAWASGVADDAWRGWWRIGDLTVPPGAPVSIVARQPGMLDVFATGKDGRVYTAAWASGVANDAWRGWWRIGDLTAPPGAPVYAVARGPELLDVFVSDSSGRIMTAAWDAHQAGGAWRGWWQVANGTAPPGAHVTAVARRPHMLDVFVVAGDKQVWTAAWDGAIDTTWRGWWPVASGMSHPGSPVPVVSRDPDKLDVFVAGLDGQVWTAAWDANRADGAWRGWWNIRPEPS